MGDAGMVGTAGGVRPSVPWVAPFAVFLLLFVALPELPIAPRADAILRTAIIVAVLLAFWSRPAVDLAIARPLASIAVGVGVFVLWIAPDLLIPGYRDGLLFQNGLLGRVESSMGPVERRDGLLVGLRFVRSALIVPVVEELFWRGWLPRWIDDPVDFRRVPLGRFSRWAFWATAVLFALEHGSWWDVGLVAGVIYNLWMRHTRSLADLVLAHAATNACLSAFVILANRWEYW